MKDAIAAFLASHPIAALAGVALYALLEYLLPRTRAVKANSLMEGVFNVLGAALGKVPWLGDVMLSLGSPQVPVLTPSLIEEVTKPGVKLPLPFIVCMLAGCLMSCAGTIGNARKADTALAKAAAACFDAVKAAQSVEQAHVHQLVQAGQVAQGVADGEAFQQKAALVTAGCEKASDLAYAADKGITAIEQGASVGGDHDAPGWLSVLERAAADIVLVMRQAALLGGAK